LSKKDIKSDLRNGMNLCAHLLACHPALTVYFLPYFPLDSFYSIDFPVSFSLCRWVTNNPISCRDVATPVTVPHTIAYFLAINENCSRQDAIAYAIASHFFRRKKKKLSGLAACILWLMAPNPAGSLSEADRPRTCLGQY